METQLPHLWNPHKIKKNQTRWNWDTEYQFGWHLHSQALSFGAEAFGFGWQGYVQENSSFGCSSPSFWLSQYTFWHSDLCPHHRGNTLVTHFLNRQIYEKKKQDNRTAMQILRSGQHLRVYGIGLPKRKHISLWGTVQGTQSARQKGVYHLSLFRGQPHTYPRNHFSNNLNT